MVCSVPNVDRDWVVVGVVVPSSLIIEIFPSSCNISPVRSSFVLTAGGGVPPTISFPEGQKICCELELRCAG